MVTYYENYMPIGDVLVVATCIVFFILIHIAYINRTRSFDLFRQMLLLLFVAALSNLTFNVLVNYSSTLPHIVIYLFRWLSHAALFANMVFYTLYIKDPLRLTDSEHRLNATVVWSVYFALIVYEIVSSLVGFGFHIDTDGTIYNGVNLFIPAYIFFILVPIVNAIRHRNEIYSRVMIGVIGCVMISVTIMLIQGIFRQHSFTAATYLFPMYALLYLLHATPYDVNIGAVNKAAFENMLEITASQKEPVYMMSLYMPEYDEASRKFPHDMQAVIRHFSSDFFKDAHLYQISSGRIILCTKVSKNPNIESKTSQILESFDRVYPDFKIDYKIVALKTVPELVGESAYIGLIQYIENRMPINNVRLVSEDDFLAYNKQCYIVDQLEDIHNKRNLNDPRILVYCQPVLNTTNNRFDTAEALMRLQLDDLGMVFPDQFIPIAEKHHYIHSLSMIILAKTCAQVRQLMEDGYCVERVSVNFSMLDVREDDFCRSVTRIIEDSGIPYEKIAIELTESQSEKDFIIIKDKINELKDTGIKFYLDDFGTGYSNFDRIIELPFDIVKFDRTLVIASGTDVKSATMVKYLAHMFIDMNYSVLYEGIEDENDELRCRETMFARYLQGYKYSRPIPIERLTEFFSKEETTK